MDKTTSEQEIELHVTVVVRGSKTVAIEVAAAILEAARLKAVERNIDAAAFVAGRGSP